jgi:hypothetical protein
MFDMSELEILMARVNMAMATLRGAHRAHVTAIKHMQAMRCEWRLARQELDNATEARDKAMIEFDEAMRATETTKIAISAAAETPPEKPA